MLLIYFSSQSWWALGMLGVILLLAIILVVQAHRHRVQGGNEELPGMAGEMTQATDERGAGYALVRGEVWRVHAAQALPAGQPIRVRAARGLLLEVEPADGVPAVSLLDPDPSPSGKARPLDANDSQGSEGEPT